MWILQILSLFRITVLVIIFLTIESVHGDVRYTDRRSIADDIISINSIKAADTNYDGRQDVITGGPRRLSVIRRTSSGSYTKPRNYGAQVRGVEATDFMKLGDENVNIVVACSRSKVVDDSETPTGAIQLLKENPLGGTPRVTTLIGSTKLQGPTEIMTKVNGRDIKVIDIDKDGDLDIIATVDGKTSEGSLIGFLVLLRNDGRGNFETEILSENLLGKAVIGVGDFDEDGNTDIAVLCIDAKRLDAYYQENDDTFTRKQIDQNIEANLAIDVGLFNEDKAADIFILGRTNMTGYLAVRNIGMSKVRGFTKNDLFTFAEEDHLEVDYRWWQIRLYDADRDGLTDILAIYGKQNGIKWMRQRSDLKINGPVDLVSVGSPRTFDINDMTKDGLPDIIVQSASAESLYLYKAVKI